MKEPLGMEEDMEMDDFALTAPSAGDFFEIDSASLQARKEDITMDVMSTMPLDCEDEDDMFVPGRADLLASIPSKSSTPARNVGNEEETFGMDASPEVLRDAGEQDIGIDVDVGGQEPFQDIQSPMMGHEEEIQEMQDGDLPLGSPGNGGLDLPGGWEEELGGGSPAQLDISSGVKRKRPIVDEVMVISATQIREQLQDSTNILRDWAPPPVPPPKKKSKKAKQAKPDDIPRAPKRKARLAFGQPMMSGLPESLRAQLQQNLQPIVAARRRKKATEQEEEEADTRGDSVEKAREAGVLSPDGLLLEDAEGVGPSEDRVDHWEEEPMMPVSGIDADFVDVDVDMGADLQPDLGADVEGPDFTPAEIAHPLDDSTQTQVEEEAGPQAIDKNTGWSARTQKSLQRLKNLMPDRDTNVEVSFNEVVRAAGKNLRRNAAHQFFEMLVLHSRSYVQLKQAEPYADLTVTPGEKFHSVGEKFGEPVAVV